MQKENKALIEEYYRHPQGYGVMEKPTVTAREGNAVCGDDLVVYLRIVDDVIEDYSFSGDISMHTIAASSFWYEFLVNAKIKDVLTWTDSIIQEEGFILSTRRQKAGAIALLAVRNAIHKLYGDGVMDSFDDVLT